MITRVRLTQSSYLILYRVRTAYTYVTTFQVPLLGPLRAPWTPGHDRYRHDWEWDRTVQLLVRTRSLAVAE